MADETKKEQEKAREELGVATEKQNAKLEHSQGGATTRDDALDAGAPMLQGDPSEPQGPEDAFGRGPKRGDYTDRLGGVNSAQSVATEDGGEAVTDDDGNVVDFKPTSRLESQNARAEDIGEKKGQKGGVDTDPIAAGT